MPTQSTLLNEHGGVGAAPFGGLLDLIARNQRQRQGIQSPQAAQSDREGAALALIRSNPGLSAAFAGEAANTPAAQGLLTGLASPDPVARQLAGVTAEGVSGATSRQQQAKIDRIARQRESLSFTLDTQQKLLDLEVAGLNRNKLLRERERGFATREEELATTMTVGNLNETLRSLEAMQKVRNDLGILGPVDRAIHPDAFATVETFMFDKIILFKNLAEDTRISDEDRAFYREVGQPSFLGRVFGGGRIEKSFLENLNRRLQNTMNQYEFIYPELKSRRPDLFTRPDLNADLGVAVKPKTLGEELRDIFGSAAQQGLTIGVGGPVGGSL